MTDDGLAWFENVLGAASNNEQADMSDARCPKCDARDFVKIADPYGKSGAWKKAPNRPDAPRRTDRWPDHKSSPAATAVGRGRRPRRGRAARGGCLLCVSEIRRDPGPDQLRRRRVVTIVVLMTKRALSDKYSRTPPMESDVHVPQMWSARGIVSDRSRVSARPPSVTPPGKTAEPPARRPTKRSTDHSRSRVVRRS